MAAHKKQKSQFRWHKKQVPLFPKLSNVFRKVVGLLRKGWNVLRPYRGKLLSGLVACIGLWAICRPTFTWTPFENSILLPLFRGIQGF